MLRSFFFVAFMLIVNFASAAERNVTDSVARYVVEDQFKTVKEDLILAIQNHGLVIDSVSHIHKMLERTGKDLGTPEQIYREAQAFSFCSATASRKMMQKNSHDIAFCPFVIAVYVLVNEPNKVYVSYRRPPLNGASASQSGLKAVDELLDSIVREALNLKD